MSDPTPEAGEMERLIRGHDWAATPLGPMEAWPPGLKVAARLLVNSRHPMFIWWGPELVQLYNDAYRETMGPETHPCALGGRGRETWAEIWDVIGPQIERVMNGGGSTWHENQLVPMTRRGRREDVWWTYGFSPIDDETAPGGVGGVLVICTETTRQVLAERRLAAEAERQRRLFEQAPGFICVLSGPEHVYEFVNAAYVRLMGERAFIGRPVREVVPELAGQGFFERLDQVYATGERFVAHGVPIRLQRSPGAALEERALDFVYQPILGADARVTGIFVEGADVTEARRAQERLGESEERYRLIVEGARNYAIFTIGLDGRIETWPPGAEAVFGWSAAEAIGQPVAMTFVPEDRAQGEPGGEIGLARASGSAPNVRWHLRKDGSRVFIEGSLSALHDGAGAVRRYVKIGQDVTRARLAEQRIARSERRLRSLVEGIPQLVWRAGGAGRWTWSSPQWSAYTGLSAQASRDLGWLAAVHPDDRAGALDAWREAEGQNLFQADFRLRHAPGGRQRWFQTRAAPVRDEDGRILEWLGTSTDVDDLRGLQEHQRLLLAELQHRVRNTLGVIRSIARRTALTSESVESYAMHLDGRLNAFGRIQAAVTRDPAAGLDLAQLVADELAAWAAHEGKAVRIEGPPLRLQPKAAETFALALHELATNAVKHGALGAPQGRIEVTWTIRGDDEPELFFTWIENGLPQPPAAPRRRGFGTDLLERTLAYELKAVVTRDFAPDGLRCAIAVPLTEHFVKAAAGPGRFEM